MPWRGFLGVELRNCLFFLMSKSRMENVSPEMCPEALGRVYHDSYGQFSFLQTTSHVPFSFHIFVSLTCKCCCQWWKAVGIFLLCLGSGVKKPGFFKQENTQAAGQVKSKGRKKDDIGFFCFLSVSVKDCISKVDSDIRFLESLPACGRSPLSHMYM